MGMNPELPGVNFYITTCIHGVDLRFTPRCYLCKPAPDGSVTWRVTGAGHVHDGEWCAKCVEHGRAIDATPILAFAKALFKEVPLCTGCDMAHGWDDHVLGLWDLARLTQTRTLGEGE